MNSSGRNLIISGGFDDLRSPQVRFLEEAHRLGFVHLCLWSDSLITELSGRAPKFPHDERFYILQSLRYVNNIQLITSLPDADSLPIPIWDELSSVYSQAMWVVEQENDNPKKRLFCASMGLGYQVIPNEDLSGFPIWSFDGVEGNSSRKKVIVTGCYDWLHSGHIRFFEEVSVLGDLFVVVGSDDNVHLLKGDGHPLFCQDERRYMVQAVRFVKAALISSGEGWMDAEPEIDLIKPDIYAVNEDGDKPEKRRYCAEHGLEYVVLNRLPRPGLARRESTVLRGF